MSDGIVLRTQLFGYMIFYIIVVIKTAVKPIHLNQHALSLMLGGFAKIPTDFVAWNNST
jgi:hypothetical protein